MTIHRVLLCVLAACGGDESACEDPKYGDGTCDLDTSCSMPDVDCFTTFETQSEAETFAIEIDALKHAGKPPRTIIPASDPRFIRMRRLLDRTWDAYRDAYEIGDMADATPQLVVFEDPSLNAFLPGDIHKDFNAAALVVVANSGVGDLLSNDEQIIGILAHELEHALGLHVIAEIKKRFTRYYIAPGTEEPFGFEQPDQAPVRMIAEQWIGGAQEIGHHTEAELGGWPAPGTNVIRVAFEALVAARLAANPTACNAAVAQMRSAEQMITTVYDGVDDSLRVEGSNAKTVLDAAIVKLRDECMAGFTPDFIQILAAVQKRDPAAVRQELSAADRALFEGKHAIDGAYAFVSDRRRKMRMLQSQFTMATGQPWSRVRYFSTEEAADDASVAVMRAAGIEADVLADALPVLYGAGSPAENKCRDLLAAGTRPPYGENLADDHHAPCWRSRHIQDFAASGKQATRVMPATRHEPPRSPLVPAGAVFTAW